MQSKSIKASKALETSLFADRLQNEMKVVIVTVLLSLALEFTSAKDWYETAAYYQIYPQTFFDDGKSGTGTFSGIQSKLDYLKDLGVDCLWLTPIFKSSFNSFGYDITDYKDLDPRYGDQKTFKALIDAVHERGMKIIVDFVPNHCGEAHEFFQKSIRKQDNFDDWFVWSNITNNAETGKPSNWQRIGGGPGSGWTKNEIRNEFYYSQFSSNMPDLNLRNQKVLDYLKGVMDFWLKLNIDGFRVDAISHGVEVEKDQDGKYPNEPVVAGVVNPEDFGYLDHKFTQDQPELFEIIYDWRKFMNDYQKENKGDVR
jgi:alpha-glucosidase